MVLYTGWIQKHIFYQSTLIKNIKTKSAKIWKGKKIHRLSKTLFRSAIAKKNLHYTWKLLKISVKVQYIQYE